MRKIYLTANTIWEVTQPWYSSEQPFPFCLSLPIGLPFTIERIHILTYKPLWLHKLNLGVARSLQVYSIGWGAYCTSGRVEDVMFAVSPNSLSQQLIIVSLWKSKPKVLGYGIQEESTLW